MVGRGIAPLHRLPKRIAARHQTRQKWRALPTACWAILPFDLEPGHGPLLRRLHRCPPGFQRLDDAGTRLLGTATGEGELGTVCLHKAPGAVLFLQPQVVIPGRGITPREAPVGSLTARHGCFPLDAQPCAPLRGGRLVVFFSMGAPRASVSAIVFCGVALLTVRRRKPRRLRPAAIVLGEGPWSSPSLCVLKAARADRAVRRGEGQGRAQRWGLLRVRFSHLAPGVRGLGLRVFPRLATAEGRWRPETPDPRTSLRTPSCNGPTAPPDAGCGQQRIAPTLLQGPCSLKSTPWRARHFGGCQAHISNLRRTKRRMSIPYRVVQAHPTTSRTSEGFLYPEECWACFLSHSKIFSGNRLRASGGDGTFYQTRTIQKVFWSSLTSTIPLSERPAQWFQ